MDTIKRLFEAVERWVCQMCGEISIGDWCLHCGAHRPQ